MIPKWRVVQFVIQIEIGGLITRYKISVAALYEKIPVWIKVEHLRTLNAMPYQKMFA